MRILLIKPRSTSDGITPPLGLGYLAAMPDKDHEVNIVDGILKRLSIKGLMRCLEKFRPGLTGIQLLSLDLSTVNAYLKAIKGYDPNIVTVVGGPHCTALPKETLEFFGHDLDYAIQGEAELGFLKLIKAISKGHDKVAGQELKDIHGLVWREGDKINLNQPNIVKDMDILPPPRWDLLKPHLYPPAPHGAFFRRYPVAPISISRGCPFSCAFCLSGNSRDKAVRYRGLRKVFEDIGCLQTEFGIKEIHIIDDNFTFEREYVKHFCKGIKERELDLTWTCPNGVVLSSLNEDIIKDMKGAGCYALSVGVESGSPRIQGLIKKNMSLRRVKDRVDLISANGIDIIGFFVLGFPTETIEEMRMTMELASRLDIKGANFMLFHPFPGTGLHRWILENEGPDKIRYDTPYSTPAYSPDGITLKRLKWLQREAFLRFYLRPRAFLTLLRRIKSVKHGYFIIKRIFRWMM